MIQKIQITDRHMQGLEFYAGLTENQLRHYCEPREEGFFIAESPKTVKRALDAGYKPLSVLIDERDFSDAESLRVLSECEEKNPHLAVYTADAGTLTDLLHFKMLRGMLCLMKRRSQPQMEEIIRTASRIAVLENVMNPTNIGAIFRSAAALGMDAVLLTRGCSDPLYRRSIRVSMGTVFQIPWTYIGHPTKGRGKHQIRRQITEEEEKTQIFAELRENGFKTAALALKDDSVSLDDPALKQEKKLAIVLGTEGDGLAQDTIADCDYTVRIPMLHGVDSLNVAAASAVAFWELRKRSDV